MNLVRIRRPKNLTDIQDEMNRLIENAFESLGITAEPSKSGNEIVWRPAIELNEQDGNYQLKAELPGISKDNIDVEVGENSVTVKAETEESQEEKKENTYNSEFRYGKFIRTIQLPSEIDNSKAKAEFKDGILTVTVPKSQQEQAKTKKLNIE